MTIVGENNVDIKLDSSGQPVIDKNGDFATVKGDECWQQDLRMEGITEEGELFYEDEDGDESYGFGLLDFSHAENDEFTQTEIMQRIRGKLAKRTYVDMAKTTQEIVFKNGIYHNKVAISTNNSDDEYNIELSTEEVEVDIE